MKYYAEFSKDFIIWRERWWVVKYMGSIIGFIHKTYYEIHFHEEKHMIQVFWKKEKLSLI